MRPIGKRDIGILGIVKIDLLYTKEGHLEICAKIDFVWYVYLYEKLI